MFNLGKNFFLLWQGLFISQLGTQAFNIARIYWLVQTVGKGYYIGALLTICSFALTIFSPIGGYFSDHYDRKKIVIVSDLVSGLSMLFLAFLMLYSKSIILQTTALFICSIIVSILTSFLNPAIQSSLPNIVEKDKLLPANSAISSSFHIGQIIGQGFGGLIIIIIGIPLMILINGISFILSAFSESFIDFKQDSMSSKSKNTKKQSFIPFKRIIISIKEGIKEIKSNTKIITIIIYTSIDSFLVAPIFVITPFLASTVYHGGADYYGYLIGIFSIGMLTGYFYTSHANINQKFLKIALSLKAFSMLALGFSQDIYSGLVLFFIIGFSSATIEARTRTFIQLTIKNEVLGRVFGMINGINNILIPISFATAGILIGISFLNVSVLFFIYGLLSCLLVIWTYKKNLVSNEFYKF